METLKKLNVRSECIQKIEIKLVSDKIVYCRITGKCNGNLRIISDNLTNETLSGAVEYVTGSVVCPGNCRDGMTNILIPVLLEIKAFAELNNSNREYEIERDAYADVFYIRSDNE